MSKEYVYVRQHEAESMTLFLRFRRLEQPLSLDLPYLLLCIVTLSTSKVNDLCSGPAHQQHDAQARKVVRPLLESTVGDISEHVAL